MKLSFAKAMQHPDGSGVALLPRRLLQRKCACGESVGGQDRCEECKKKDRLLQRRSSGGAQPSDVPAIVHEVLGSPGAPLDAATRAFFEPRFGYDFSRVRIHADSRAAESAGAVNALAYTFGLDIVFGHNQFDPKGSAGQRLLAHELVHVVQQGGSAMGNTIHGVNLPSDPLEGVADRGAEEVLRSEPVLAKSLANITDAQAPQAVQRRPGGTGTCVGGVNRAPADPAAALADADSHAQGLAQATSNLLALISAALAMGLDTSNDQVLAAYQDRFRTPPARPGGFLNRLTGNVRPTRNQVLGEETEGMASRYQMIADNFDHPIEYLCISGPTDHAGCAANCVRRDATACAGIRVIFLCPTFWRLGNTERATLLIHESAHMIWPRVIHGGRGAGGNFLHAECYASLVSDLFGGRPGTPACPP